MDADEAAAVAVVLLERGLLRGVEHVAGGVEEDDDAVLLEVGEVELAGVVGDLHGEAQVLAELSIAATPALVEAWVPATALVKTRTRNCRPSLAAGAVAAAGADAVIAATRVAAMSVRTLAAAMVRRRVVWTSDMRVSAGHQVAGCMSVLRTTDR